MRNVPFAFLNEETIDQINRAAQKRRQSVNALANLAEAQVSLRGVLSWSDHNSPFEIAMQMMKVVARRLILTLEKMMEMSGPNSVANLERALRAQHPSQDGGR